MKKLLFLFSVLVLIGCKKESQESFGKPDITTINEGVSAEVQTPEKLGQEIFEGKGTCISCHETDVKLIGPSLQDIAKIYKEKGGSIVNFLKEKSDPIVDPSQYASMKSNIALTKTMTDEELKALEAYVYSTLK